MPNLPDDIAAALDLWRKWDVNAATLAEIERLVAAGDEKELRDRLVTRLQFGTAGILFAT